MADSSHPSQPVTLYRLPPPDSTPAASNAVDCVVALRALAEDTRVRIMGLLIDQPLDVTEIAARVGISQYNASKHLRVLHQAGLLEQHKSGRRHLYTVSQAMRQRSAGSRVLDLGCCRFQFEPPAPRRRARRPRARR